MAMGGNEALKRTQTFYVRLSATLLLHSQTYECMGDIKVILLLTQMSELGSGINASQVSRWPALVPRNAGLSDATNPEMPEG